MLQLLAPMLGAAVSGAFNMAGSSGRSDRIATMSNIMNTNTQNDIDRGINSANFKSSQKMAQNQFQKQMAMAQAQFSEQINQANIDRDLQREFAQNGVQWRVNDAQNAGIHPLAALGAQLSTSSPIAISGGVPSGSVPQAAAASHQPLPQMQASKSVQNAMSQTGQDISRAITATATAYERENALGDAASALSLENQQLQNQILKQQLSGSTVAKTLGAATGPPMPSNRSKHMMDGQGNSPSSRSALTDPQPLKLTITAKGNSDKEPGDLPDVGYSKTQTGYAVQPGDLTKERIEDDLIGQTIWHARNRLLQTFGKNLNPPRHVPLEEGKEWHFHPFRQEYYQAPPNPGYSTK